MDRSKAADGLGRDNRKSTSCQVPHVSPCRCCVGESERPDGQLQESRTPPAPFDEQHPAGGPADGERYSGQSGARTEVEDAAVTCTEFHDYADVEPGIR